MNFKKSPYSIKDNDKSDFNNIKEYSTLKELIEEQDISSDLSDYWDKECVLNPSHPHCLVYED